MPTSKVKSKSTDLDHVPDKDNPRMQTWKIGETQMLRVPKKPEGPVEDHACVVSGITSSNPVKDILNPALESAKKVVAEYPGRSDVDLSSPHILNVTPSTDEKRDFSSSQDGLNDLHEGTLDKYLHIQAATTFVGLYAYKNLVHTVAGGDSLAFAIGFDRDNLCEGWSVKAISGKEMKDRYGMSYHSSDDLSGTLSTMKLRPEFLKEYNKNRSSKRGEFRLPYLEEVYNTWSVEGLLEDFNLPAENIYVGVFTDGFANASEVQSMCNAMQTALNHSEIEPDDSGTFPIIPFLTALESRKDNPKAKVNTDGTFYDDVTMAITRLSDACEEGVLLVACDGVGSGKEQSADIAYAVTQEFSASALRVAAKKEAPKERHAAPKSLLERLAALPPRSHTFSR